MPGVDSLHARGASAPGTALVLTARGKERTGQIAALEPGRSITLRSVQGGVTANYVCACSQQDAGTRVSLTVDCRTSGTFRLLGPVIWSAIRRADAGELDAFAATFSTE